MFQVFTARHKKEEPKRSLLCNFLLYLFASDRVCSKLGQHGEGLLVVSEVSFAATE